MSEQTEQRSVAAKLRLHDNDSGSPQVQVALLTERIQHLSSHFQAHRRDFSSRQGLLQMVSRRRRLLKYLKHHSEDTYRQLLEGLKLRK